MTDDRLLIIDDDSGFRNFVRRVGESAGYAAFATDDATLFKEQVRAWEPSVMMIDLNMPGTDGVELIRDLAAAKPAGRILLMSGADVTVLKAAERLATARGLAVAGTLHKPVRAAAMKHELLRLQHVDRPLLAGALAHAVENDELMLEYQPKVECRSGLICGVEALVRWCHPTRGLVPPDQFIPLAEQSGVIHVLTEWVLDAALRQGAAWRRAGTPIGISVNFSARNLENVELPDIASAKCADHGVPPRDLTIEVTETAAMGDLAQSIDVLVRLRLKGFCLSIDDFGAGHSSFYQLRKLPFTEIKLDRSLIQSMAHEPECHAIAEAIAGLARKLGMSVVAEGIEDAQLYAMVSAMGADFAQGYYLGRPAAPARIADLIKENASHPALARAPKDGLAPIGRAAGVLLPATP